MFDGEAFGQHMVEIVRGYVAAELEPLRAENKAFADANAALVDRIVALEARELPEAIKGDPGDDCDMAAVEAMLAAKVAEAVAALPAAEKGDAGDSVTAEDVRPMVAELVADVVKAIPVPKDGEDGKPGKAAEIDMAAVAELIDKAVAARPAPKDGADCDMGAVAQMVAERVKAAVDAIPSAKDGVGLASAFKDQDGNLILTMTNGETRNLGRIDGAPGKNGFDLDDFDTKQLDDGRTIELSFTRGDMTYTHEIQFPVMIYRGVWQEGRAYEAGDTTTWAGSIWVAEKATEAKPDSPDGAWKLAVKRARDGKDATK